MVYPIDTKSNNIFNDVSRVDRDITNALPLSKNNFISDIHPFIIILL